MNKFFLTTSLLILSTTVSKAESVYMCEPCPAGYSCDKGVKTLCPAGTYSNAAATSCTKCPAGTYSKGGTSSCTPCPEGTYSQVSGGTSSSVCTACPDGHYQNAKGQASCKKCTGEMYLGYVRRSSSWLYEWVNVDTKLKCHKSEFTHGNIDPGDQYCCAVPSHNDAHLPWSGGVCAAPAGYYGWVKDNAPKCGSDPAQYKKLTFGCDKVTGELYVEGCLGRIWAHQTQHR